MIPIAHTGTTANQERWERGGNAHLTLESLEGTLTEGEWRERTGWTVREREVSSAFVHVSFRRLPSFSVLFLSSFLLRPAASPSYLTFTASLSLHLATSSCSLSHYLPSFAFPLLPPVIFIFIFLLFPSLIFLLLSLSLSLFTVSPSFNFLLLSLYLPCLSFPQLPPDVMRKN